MAVTTPHAVEGELEQLLAQTRLIVGDVDLAPGDLFTASVQGIQALPAGVQAQVSWSVRRVDDTPLPAPDVDAPGGLAGAQVELRIRPEIAERRAPAASPAARVVRAQVTLSAQPDPQQPPISATRDLDREVAVHPLAVPSVLALFRNPGFLPNTPKEGCGLVVVPTSSPLASVTAVRTALNELQAAVDRLSPFPAFATLRQRLPSFKQALTQHDADNVKLRRSDALVNLNEITLIQNGPLTNDIEAEDELSSLMLLGPAGRTARCYVRRNLDPAAGELVVAAGNEAIVLIGNLHSRTPASVPGGRVRVPTAPSGSRTFGDELSSLRLVPPRFRCRLRGVATLTIDHPQAGGPKTAEVNVGLAFGEDRRTVVLEDFPPIVLPEGEITQVREAQGSFDPATGTMSLPTTLEFAVGGFVGSPTITFGLTTATASRGIFTETGSPLDRATGEIVLVGVGTFDGGALGGHHASLVIDGSIDPIP